MGTWQAHVALLTAALIYSLYNVLTAQIFQHGRASPVAFAAIREALAIHILYIWAAVAEAPLRVPQSR